MAGLIISWFSTRIRTLDLEIVEKQEELSKTKKLVEITEKKADDYLLSAELREKKSFELLNYIEGDIQSLYPQPTIKSFFENKEGFKTIAPVFTIYFKNNKSNITTNAKKILDSIIPELIRKPNTQIKITGFTSKYSWITENNETILISSGLEKRSLTYSQRLSERYAKSTTAYFVSKGIDPKRFIGFGRGIYKPKYNLDYMNNRVEISITRDVK